MATLGQTLQEARKQKKVTASEAAAATRIKVQHIMDIERDVFDNIAAPTYAKGFIKIYAEYLGIDSAPLIQDYLEHYASAHSILLLHENPKAMSREKRRDQTGGDKKSAFLTGWKHRKKAVLWGSAIFPVFLVLLYVGRCRINQKADLADHLPTPTEAKPNLGLIQDLPPEPYLEPIRE